MDAALERLSRQCEAYHKNDPEERSGSSYLILDTAREVIALDEEQRAQKTFLRRMAYRYPWIKPTALFGAGVVCGFTLRWLLS